MRTFIAIIIGLAGLLLGLYVGGWVLFVKPILLACKAFDAGMLTASIVGMTVIKCIFASVVGSLIAGVAYIVIMIIGGVD